MSDVGHRGVGERIDYSCNLIRISGGGGGHYCLVSHRAGGDCGVSLPGILFYSSVSIFTLFRGFHFYS